MSSDGTPMLFFPPQPPYQLPQDASVVVLGRSGSCEVRLPDADTSRRHAKIVFAQDGFVLHDLASTNGTFVNGERIEQRRLEPGDRIQVGANVVTFCSVKGGLGGTDDGDAQTVLLERPVQAEIFRGDLSEIPPFAVLQILEMGRKTGLLHIDSGAPGKLWLSRGDPVHAEMKNQIGFDAAVTMVNATEGRFVFEPQLETPAPTIEASVTQLLLEASRRLDEGLV